MNERHTVKIFSIPHGRRELNVVVGKRSDGSVNVQPVRVPDDSELIRPLSSFRTGADVEVVLRHALDGKPYLELAPQYMIPRVDVVEDLTHEFKTSMFVAPGQTAPGTQQMETIAQTVASFMNASGGILYLGVEDKHGQVVGLKSDLEWLSLGVPAVVSYSASSDSGYTYRPNIDSYRNKFKKIVEGYLETSALAYLGEIKEVCVGDRAYLAIEIKPAPDNRLVYFWSEKEYERADGTKERIWVADLFVRYDNGKKKLRGKARDEFVMSRRDRVVRDRLESIQAAQPGVSAEELAEKLKGYLVPKSTAESVLHRVGYAHPLTEATIANISDVGVLYYKDGTDEMKSVRLAKSTYQELYVALLKVLNELDGEKFAALPDNTAFMPQRKGAATPPNFARKAAGRGAGVHMKNASEYIGTVRANLQGISKATFFDPKKLPLRLMSHFGVGIEDFSVGK